MNCKVGDLAYIVESIHEENLGAVVEVLSFDPGVQMWLCQSCRPLQSSLGTLDDVGYVEDYRLRPISGVPIHDEEEREVTA